MINYLGTHFTLCCIGILSVILFTEGTVCPDEFDDVCECGYVPYGSDKKLTYVVNCTNSGFDHATMLRKLPQQTEVLIFVGNEVKDLPLNIFGQDVVYEKLHTIDLSNNHIQSIKGRTFHNVANVTKLILNDNDLYIVSKDHHPRMFSNFVNLKELHLRNAFTEKLKSGDYLINLAEILENSTLNHLTVLDLEHNEISSIHRNEFCSLPSLETLRLGNNHLKDIPLNFTCLKNLRTLDVGSNLIPYLSDTTLQNLEHVKNVSHLTINLTANPFQCDCNMVRTYIWIISSPITLPNREGFYCLEGFPPIVGKPIAAIQLDELQCIPTLKEYHFHYSASLITLTVGLCFIFICVTALIYRNRESVSASWRRIVYPIRTKFHYVSLDRRATMDV